MSEETTTLVAFLRCLFMSRSEDLDRLNEAADRLEEYQRRIEGAPRFNRSADGATFALVDLHPTELHRRETERSAEAECGAIGVPPSPIPQGERTDAGSVPACQHPSTGDDQ